ncbi:MAG TPA: M28 family peptidase [Candidatus Methylomirabilis sp.]|nr:M28 family peptidase [Candidatus Methylomirabilis sp.]
MRGIDASLDLVARSVSESVARRHLERIVGPRDPFDGHAGMEATADYVADVFRRLGHSVVEDKFRVEGGWYRNVVASIKGSSSDGEVLVVAHYDTVPDTPGGAV